MRHVVVLLVALAGCSAPAPARVVDEAQELRRRADVAAAAADWKRERARRIAATQQAVADQQARNPAFSGRRLEKGMTVQEAGVVLAGRQLLGPRPAANLTEVALAVEFGPGEIRFVEVRRWTFVDAKAGSVHQLEALLVLRNGAIVAWTGSGEGGPNLSTDMLAYRGL